MPQRKSEEPLIQDSKNSKQFDAVSHLINENKRLHRKVNTLEKEAKKINNEVKQTDDEKNKTITSLRVENKSLEKDVLFFRATNLCREIGAVASVFCGVTAPFFFVKWQDNPYFDIIYSSMAACAVTSIIWGIYHGRIKTDNQKASNCQKDRTHPKTT